jgi:hypothetical protein
MIVEGLPGYRPSDEYYLNLASRRSVLPQTERKRLY